MRLAWIHDYSGECQRIFWLHHSIHLYYWHLLEGRAVSAYFFIYSRIDSWNFLLFSRIKSTCSLFDYLLTSWHRTMVQARSVISLPQLNQPFLWGIVFPWPLFCLFVCLFFAFLRPNPWHMEVSRLGGKSELQLPAYTMAKAMQDPSRVCNLHHSSRQPQIPDPLSEARDQTCIVLNTSWIHFHFAARTSEFKILMILFYFYSWFTVFSQFSMVQQSDPSHIHMYILFLTLFSIISD